MNSAPSTTSFVALQVSGPIGMVMAIQMYFHQKIQLYYLDSSL